MSGPGGGRPAPGDPAGSDKAPARAGWLAQSLTSLILRLLYPCADRDVLVGDLHEELGLRRREGRSASRTAAWLAGQLAGTVAHGWWRMLRWLRAFAGRRLPRTPRSPERAGTVQRLHQDLRYALRVLRRQPLFSGVAILTLALGIASTTTIFTVVDGVLLRPLDFPEADRLVAVWESSPQRGYEQYSVSYLNFRDWQRQADSFEGLAALDPSSVDVRTDDGVERVAAVAASASLFEVLGVSPARGRGFREGEDVAGRDRVAVVTAGFARRFLGDRGSRREGGLAGAEGGVARGEGGSAATAGDMGGAGGEGSPGDTVTLDGDPYRVVGILDDEFTFPLHDDVEVFVPLALEAGEVRRGWHWLAVIGRLAPGVEPRQAEAELDGIAAALAAEHPDTNAGWETALVPLHEQVVGEVRAPLLGLLGAVATLLLIACVNVANLLLARGTSRRHELAVRAALGAGRGRLAAQLLVESLVLAVVGGALGVAVSRWGVQAILALSPLELPRASGVGLDAGVLGFSVAVTLGTGVLFGLAPVWQLSRSNLRGAVQERAAGTTGGGRTGNVLRALVVAEVALSVALLAGAGLLARSLTHLRAVDPGYRTEGILTFRLDLPDLRYPDDADQLRFYRALSERLAEMPAVEEVGGAQALPMQGIWTTGFYLPGDAPGEARSADYVIATPGYIGTLGIRLLQGRPPSPRDDGTAPEVAVVDELLARQLWPGSSALGRRLSFDGPEGPWLEVVGVVGATRQSSLSRRPRPTIYAPYAQRPRGGMSMAVRTGADPASLAEEVRAVVRAMDPEVPIFDVATLDDRLETSLAMPRFSSAVFGSFSVLAATLALVGIYGVVAYAAGRRTREIGLRMALGAGAADVAGLVAREGMRPVLVGLGLGVLLGVAAGRMLESQLHGVRAFDPPTLALSAGLLATVALAACLLPARRAARLDPLETLRSE